MCRQHCSIVMIALIFFSSVALSADNDTKSASQESTFGSRILTITDVVLQKHIDPPTRQQMILVGMKALYRADSRPVPNGLSTRISALASTDQITEYLNGQHAEFKHLENPEAILTHGMFTALPGGASSIDAKANKVQQQLAANRYVGVGIALSMDREISRPTIPKVFYNGPAWKVGIRSGDIILEINGKSTASKNLGRIVEELRGEEGSDVSVVVKHANSTKKRNLTMTRGRIFIPTVHGFKEKTKGEWQYQIDDATDIALIRIIAFGPSTLHELRQAADKLRKNKDIRGIVLDLREGGGRLHDTVMVADSLLDGGIIGYVQYLDTRKKHEARPGDLFRGIPIAVLVQKQMSSGNVFLTAALQDQGRAVVVGEPTSGGVYVREYVEIPGRDIKIVFATGWLQRGDGTTLLSKSSQTAIRKVESDRRMNDKNRELFKQYLKQADNRSVNRKRPGFIMPDHVVSNYTPRPGIGSHLTHPRSDAILAKAIEVLRKAAAAKSSTKDAAG